MRRTIIRIHGWFAGTADLVIVSLLVGVPLLIDMNTAHPTGPASKNLFLAYGGILALALAGVSLLLNDRLRRVRPAQVALFVLAAYLIGRALADPRPDFSLGIASSHIGAVSVALILSFLHTHRGGLNKHYIALALATGVAVIYALFQIGGYDIFFQLVYGREGTWYHPLFEEERAVVFTTFGNPNYFAHFLGPVFLLGVAPACASRRRVLRVLWAIALAVVLFVILKTYNRGIWLGLLTGGSVYVLFFIYRQTTGREVGWIRRVRLHPALIVGIIVGLALLGMLVFYLPVFEPLVRRFRTGLLLRDTSVRSRLLFWLIALLLWKGHPWFGIGLGRYDARFFDELLGLAQGPHGDTLRNLTPKMVSLRAVYAHNDYVQFLAEWGAVGFGLFMLVAVLVFAASVRLVRRDAAGSLRFAVPSVALCAAYLSFLMQMMYGFPLHLPATKLLFFFVIGSILVFEKESLPTVEHRGVSVWIGCVFVGLLCIVPWAWSLSRIPAKLSASHHLYHGLNNYKADLYQIADREFEIAASLDPEDGEIQFCRGQNYAAMDRIPQALDQYQLSLETCQNSGYYYHLGIAHIARKDYPRALQALKKLVVINPSLEGANYALGLCYFHNPFGADYNSAARYFAREVDQHPGDILSWLYLGESKMKLGDLHGARDAFRQAASISDRNIQANERLGDIYLADIDIRSPKVAMEYYRKAYVIARERGEKQVLARLRNKMEQANNEITGTP